MRISIIPAALLAAATTGIAGAADAARSPDPQIRVFKPVADAYVSAERPRTNFGRSTVLRVDGSPEETAFMRFELKQIRGKTASVTLLLHSRSAARTKYAVRRVSVDEWRERRLTYETAPQPSLRYASSRPVRRGAWSAIDVTSFVRGGGNVTLAITTHGTKELAFGSRESSQGPRLVVRTKADEDELVEDET